MRESTEQIIPIQDIHKEFFLILLEYLYTDSIQVQKDHVIELYCIADMYGLKRLQNLCCLSLKHNLSIKNTAPLLQKAADGKYEALKDVCMNFVVDNYAAVSKSKGIEHVSQTDLLVEILRGNPYVPK